VQNATPITIKFEELRPAELRSAQRDGELGPVWHGGDGICAHHHHMTTAAFLLLSMRQKSRALVAKFYAIGKRRSAKVAWRALGIPASKVRIGLSAIHMCKQLRWKQESPKLSGNLGRTASLPIA